MGRERKGLLHLGETEAVMRAVFASCLGQFRRSEARLPTASDSETLY